MMMPQSHRLMPIPRFNHPRTGAMIFHPGLIMMLSLLLCLAYTRPSHGACRGDLNSDGLVDGRDIAMIANQYGRTNCSATGDCTADTDADNDVDNDDLRQLATEFGLTACVAPTIVNGPAISVDTTWTVAGSPYIITSDIRIMGTDGPDGITSLKIQPGVEIRFDVPWYANRYALYIGSPSGDPGALVAHGTDAQPIVFTSNKDTPETGDWRGIRFYNTTDDATTILEHCIVQYAGSTLSDWNYGTLFCDQASPTFRNLTVHYSMNYGAYIDTSAPIFENCTFSDNLNYDLLYTGTVGGSVTGSTINSGISLLATGRVSFSNNTINQNNDFPINAYADSVGSVVSGSSFNNVDAASYILVSGAASYIVSESIISHDATWTADVPYVITKDISVQGTDGSDDITCLTLQPGAVLKFNPSCGLMIGTDSGDPGALIARGEAGNQILFTSSQPAPDPGAWGAWDDIGFSNTSDDATTVLEHCVVEYGGRGFSLYDAAPRILNTVIRNTRNGIYADGSGVDMSTTTINCNTFSGNQTGIYWRAGPAPEMRNNNFSGNTDYGIRYTATEPLNAEDNWWGDINGPNNNGDKTYGNIDTEPWARAEKQCSAGGPNYPPNTPAGPVPEDNAVRVSTNEGTILTWYGGDPNPLDTVTYDLFIGLSDDNLVRIAQDISGSQSQVQGLSAGTTYLWQIKARDNNNLETTGPVWRFTTDGDPPDLIVSNIAMTPGGNLQSGQPATLSVDIHNIGAGPAVEAFVVDFTIDGTGIASVQIDPIFYDGDTITVSQTWTYNGGDPSIQLTVDSNSRVAEENEANNQYHSLLSGLADMTAPLLMLTNPSDGSYLQQIRQITFTLADSQSSVDHAEVISSVVLIDGSQQQVPVSTSAGDDTFTLIPHNLPLADGVYQVRLSAMDTYGNTQNYSFEFTIDSLPPAQPVITGGTVAGGTIAPRPELNTASQFIVELTGTREADTSVVINGSQLVGLGDTPWSVELVLMPGENAIEVWLVDRAGNRGPSQWVDIAMAPGSGINYQYNSAGRLQRAVSQ